MTPTYNSVKAAVQILIDKGLDNEDAHNFLQRCYGLEMRQSWAEVRRDVHYNHRHILEEVERMHNLVPKPKARDDEQLEIKL